MNTGVLIALVLGPALWLTILLAWCSIERRWPPPTREREQALGELADAYTDWRRGTARGTIRS